MIRIATKQAKRSNFERARVGAVICRGSRVMSSGINSIRYNGYITSRRFPESVHAEQAAVGKLLRERRLHDLIGSTCFVSRVSNIGTRMAKPCIDCEQLLRAVGVKKVVYTTNDGIAEMRL